MTGFEVHTLVLEATGLPTDPQPAPHCVCLLIKIGQFLPVFVYIFVHFIPQFNYKLKKV